MYYFGIIDILAKVGGLMASVMPVMRFLNPFLFLYFLVRLASIYRNSCKDKYIHDLYHFVEKCELHLTNMALPIDSIHLEQEVKEELMGLKEMTSEMLQKYSHEEVRAKTEQYADHSHGHDEEHICPVTQRMKGLETASDKIFEVVEKVMA